MFVLLPNLYICRKARFPPVFSSSNYHFWHKSVSPSLKTTLHNSPRSFSADIYSANMSVTYFWRSYNTFWTRKLFRPLYNPILYHMYLLSLILSSTTFFFSCLFGANFPGSFRNLFKL